MSKNIVDAVIDFVEETDNNIGFIPSRRQIEYDGGYVNNWTTKEFSEYVNGRVPIERDHGGPGQGYTEDNGLTSFIDDSKYLDIIHIDPWKMFSDFDRGLHSTITHMKILLDNTSLFKSLRLFNDLGFVPTMGGIHKGHLSLINKSNKILM